jgi:hypothetical protein
MGAGVRVASRAWWVRLGRRGPSLWGRWRLCRARARACRYRTAPCESGPGSRLGSGRATREHSEAQVALRGMERAVSGRVTMRVHSDKKRPSGPRAFRVTRLSHAPGRPIEPQCLVTWSRKRGTTAPQPAAPFDGWPRRAGARRAAGRLLMRGWRRRAAARGSPSPAAMRRQPRCASSPQGAPRGLRLRRFCPSRWEEHSAGPGRAGSGRPRRPGQRRAESAVS